jgi:AraC-like DNA-binding protein
MNIINSANPHNSDRASSDHLVVNNCGYQIITQSNVTTIREQGRLDYQLLYIWKGCGYFLIHTATEAPAGSQAACVGRPGLSEMTKVTAGQIVLYRPGQKQYYTYLAEDACHAFWLHFTGTGAETYLRSAGFTDQSVLTVGCHHELIDRLQQIMREIQLRQPAYELLCRAWLIELTAMLARFGRAQPAGRNADSRERLLTVLEYMQNHYFEDHDNDWYARMCQLSTYRFMHLFKAYTTFSPVAFVKHTRLEKACELLASTTSGIAEIAAMVGYENPLYFSRLFSKTFGMSPSAYKNHHGGPTQACQDLTVSLTRRIDK